jgi:hypothetical protein
LRCASARIGRTEAPGAPCLADFASVSVIPALASC